MPEQPLIDAAGAADFDAKVLARSHELPVVVDFWAPWCGPCHVLGPILERLAGELAGAFALVKVDVDQSPDLGAAFGVQGIPRVIVFADGKAVDGFVGALPEAQVRLFLRRHCPSEGDRAVAEGDLLERQGQAAAAQAAYERALADPGAAPAAHLGLARLALAEGDLAAAAHHAEAVDPRSEAGDGAAAVRSVLALAEEAAAVGDDATCQARLADDPGDPEARYALGGHALAAGRYREALEHFLTLAAQDRHWRDEAARKAMLAVFGIVGPREPLSEEFRDRLRAVYY